VAKVIVINGAGAGLGRALARRFAADGETVVLLGRNVEKVQAAAVKSGSGRWRSDAMWPHRTRCEQPLHASPSVIPRIDVLINNAAVFEPFLIAEATDSQILKSGHQPRGSDPVRALPRFP
jgi:meso-butanediol dehydrogenase/(S,S)-butanediol dehydrogenase/diacetyl reductase